MIKYIIQEEKILPYAIINKKNKNTYIRFNSDYIEISKSKHLTNAQVIKLIEKNFDTYYNKYLILKNGTPDEDEIILEEQKLKLIINKNTKFSYEIINDSLIVNSNKKNILDIKKQIYQRHLESMIERIKPAYSDVLTQHDINERLIKFGLFKTKFGSYHRISDEIKLNIVLAKANINYLYYVIMHEYAHTKVFNHSSNFYSLLEKLMPNYKYYDKRLKKLSIWI